jgi:hypothetical protein
VKLDLCSVHWYTKFTTTTNTPLLQLLLPLAAITVMYLFPSYAQKLMANYRSTTGTNNGNKTRLNTKPIQKAESVKVLYI